MKSNLFNSRDVPMALATCSHVIIEPSLTHHACHLRCFYSLGLHISPPIPSISFAFPTFGRSTWLRGRGEKLRRIHVGRFLWGYKYIYVRVGGGCSSVMIWSFYHVRRERVCEVQAKAQVRLHPQMTTVLRFHAICILDLVGARPL